ncbi:MAG: hypothetical protein KJT03_18005 [Verrucomicrobiae bacterium]|nr:hypothetical protein [Verrucomicrobiae bacterium]
MERFLLPGSFAACFIIIAPLRAEMVFDVTEFEEDGKVKVRVEVSGQLSLAPFDYRNSYTGDLETPFESASVGTTYSMANYALNSGSNTSRQYECDMVTDSYVDVYPFGGNTFGLGLASSNSDLEVRFPGTAVAAQGSGFSLGTVSLTVYGDDWMDGSIQWPGPSSWVQETTHGFGRLGVYTVDLKANSYTSFATFSGNGTSDRIRFNFHPLPPRAIPFGRVRTGTASDGTPLYDLSFQSDPGDMIHLQYSTDLTTWNDIHHTDLGAQASWIFNPRGRSYGGGYQPIKYPGYDGYHFYSGALPEERNSFRDLRLVDPLQRGDTRGWFRVVAE